MGALLGAIVALLALVGCADEQAEVTMAPAMATEPATAVVVVEAKAALVPTATMVATTVVEPTATATVNPTATAEVVSIEPRPEIPVDGDDVDLESLTERTYELAVFLAEELSPRQSATDEELVAAQHLLEEMENLGYETVLQDFEVTEAFASGTLELIPGPDGDEPSLVFGDVHDESHRIFFLPFTPAKTGIVEGELVFAGLGNEEGFEGVDVEGKIALMRRGSLTFERKETNASERGAIGAVVFNNEPRFYFGGRLDEESDILAGGIPREDGEMLQDAIEDGEVVNVEILVYPVGNGPSRNVVAELNNDIFDDEVVLIGAHYDTTPWSAGANDNGSGVASALIVAEELADDDLPFDLRFVFFGSEETGLHGSRHYANDLSMDEVERIAAMINLDVLATGDIEAFGTSELTDVAEEVANDLEIDLDIIAGLGGASSDHAPFAERDVPHVMFFANDLRYINDPADTLEHVDPVPMGQIVAIVLGLIEDLAESMEP